MFFCPGKYVLHQLNALSLVSSVCLDLCISLSSSTTVRSSTSSSLARPFLLGLGGRELKQEEEGFWVCVCSRMWQTEVLTAYTWAPTQGGRYALLFSKNIKVCLSPPSPLIWNHTKCTIVFSSLLWAQQPISAFIAIQFYRAYAPLQLRVIRLTSVSQTLSSFYCFAKYKGYLRFNFLPQVLWQQSVNLKKEYWDFF